jgi:hypothetical protein
MRRIRELVAATAATAALVSACSSPEVSSPNEPDIAQYFDKVRNYWVSVGIGDIGRISSAKLVNIETEDDTFLCHKSMDTSLAPQTLNGLKRSDAVAEYCVAENTIATHSKNLKNKAAIVQEEYPDVNYKHFAIAHEYGHLVSEARGTAAIHMEDYDEKLADCYAGSAIAALDAAELPNIVKYWEGYTQPMGAHGSGPDMAKNISLGAKDPTAATCDDTYGM